MQKILIYTQVFYLDAALEYVKLLSTTREVYFFIEVTPESRKANIFNIDVSLQNYPDVIPFQHVVNDWSLDPLTEFVQNCKAVNFVVFKHKKSISFDSIKTAFKLSKLFNELRPDFIHYDDLSLRMLGLTLFTLKNRGKTILNVHDPKPHTGERNYKKEFTKAIFFKIVRKFVCFSEHSACELRSWLGSDSNIFTLKLLPYTIYKKYFNVENFVTPEYITFVGRVSPYKGVEIFLGAVREVQRLFPAAKFRIAGKLIPGYELSEKLVEGLKIEIINKHLTNEELANVITTSKLIVCPYLDATQSGVIMAAQALDRPVLVTPVGGLPEYIQHGKTGFIAGSITSDSLKAAMIEFLTSSPEISERAFSSEVATGYNLSILELLYS